MGSARSRALKEATTHAVVQMHPPAPSQGTIAVAVKDASIIFVLDRQYRISQPIMSLNECTMVGRGAPSVNRGYHPSPSRLQRLAHLVLGHVGVDLRRAWVFMAQRTLDDVQRMSFVHQFRAAGMAQLVNRVPWLAMLIEQPGRTANLAPLV